MIHPDLISELEWQQHGSWDSIRSLIAKRVESVMNENQRLRDQFNALQNSAMEMTDGRMTRLSQYRPEAR